MTPSDPQPGVVAIQESIQEARAALDAVELAGVAKAEIVAELVADDTGADATVDPHHAALTWPTAALCEPGDSATRRELLTSSALAQGRLRVAPCASRDRGRFRHLGHEEPRKALTPRCKAYA